MYLYVFTPRRSFGDLVSSYPFQRETKTPGSKPCSPDPDCLLHVSLNCKILGSTARLLTLLTSVGLSQLLISVSLCDDINEHMIVLVMASWSLAISSTPPCKSNQRTRLSLQAIIDQGHPQHSTAQHSNWWQSRFYTYIFKPWVNTDGSLQVLYKVPPVPWNKQYLPRFQGYNIGHHFL